MGDVRSRIDAIRGRERDDRDDRARDHERAGPDREPRGDPVVVRIRTAVVALRAITIEWDDRRSVLVRAAFRGTSVAGQRDLYVAGLPRADLASPREPMARLERDRQGHGSRSGVD